MINFIYFVVWTLCIHMSLVYDCVFRQLMKRETFDSYLSSALGVKLKDGRLQDINDSHYVLTLDYTVKVCHVYSLWV